MGFTIPKSKYARTPVTTILKLCAIRNAKSVFLFSRETISLRFVSNPMQTNASEKNS